MRKLTTVTQVKVKDAVYLFWGVQGGYSHFSYSFNKQQYENTVLHQREISFLKLLSLYKSYFSQYAWI